MKIAQKISLSFLLTALILTGITAPLFYNLFSVSLKNSIYEHLKTTVQSRQHHIETLLRSYAHNTKVLATTYSFTNLFNENEDRAETLALAAEKIKSFMGIHEDFFSIFILDKNGKVIVSNFPQDMGLDKSDTKYFARGKENAFFKDVHVFEPYGVIGIDVSNPINVDAEVVGIVCSKISIMEEMYRILTNKTGLGRTGEIYLIDGEGYMISPSRFLDSTFKKLKVNTEISQKFLEDVNKYGKVEHPHFPSIYRSYRGKRVLGVHDHIVELDWGIIAEVSEEEALGPLAIMKKILIVMSLVIIAVAGFIGFFISKRITESIRRLQSGVAIIGKGNLNYKIDVSSKDEMGRLSEEFNHMTENLKQTTTSIASLGKEIDERKKVEKVLAESRAQLKAVLDGTPDLILQLDTDMKVVWGNKAALDLCPEAIGKWCYEVYGGGTDDVCNGCPCKEALKTGKIEAGIVCKPKLKGIEGETCWEGIGVPLKNKEGKVIGILDIARNITKRKKAEEELKKAQKQIEYILGVTKTGLDIIDEEYNIVYIDPEWRKIYGDPAEIKCYEYFMGLKHPCRGCGITKAIKTKKIVVTEEKLPKEGNRPVQVSTIPFLNEKGKWMVAEINVDITERKKAEEEIEKAAQIKSDFVSMVSHELRTPLTAIREGVSIIADETAGKLTDMQKNFINLTQRNVERLSRLINDVLSFQKLESGKLDFKMVQNDINLIVEEVKKTMEPFVKKKGLKLITRTDNKLRNFKFDSDKITQVMINIVGNAVKFTDKGEITISTSLEDEKTVKVSVKDTGIGIMKNDIPKLFQRFEQLGGNDRKTGGAGLGLAICKDIVEKHGGRIRVESKIGKGAEFIFVLPIL